MTSYLVSAPVIALAATGAVTVALAIQGSNPVWHTEPLNLSEAAALRDRGEVARLLEAGADPYATRPVRAGFLYQDSTHLTAVDAAVNADRPEICSCCSTGGCHSTPTRGGAPGVPPRQATCAARSSPCSRAAARRLLA